VRDRLDAGAIVLCFAGRVVQTQPKNPREEGVQADADLWQAIVDEKELDEQRRAAKNFDILLSP
jgi:hypothetical protein